MNTVQIVRPYNPGALGSTSLGRDIFVRQSEFPFRYADDDKHSRLDHDRILDDVAMDVIEKHTGSGDMVLHNWFRTASVNDILRFLIEFCGRYVDDHDWTGFRISGTVHQRTGAPVWQIELFAKHPSSDTKVFSGEKAPNVATR